MLDAGGRIIQETRGWVDERSETVSQRSKEDANDYRYFPEPDLPPLRLSAAYVEAAARELPELPAARKARFLALGLTRARSRTADGDRASGRTTSRRVAAAIGGRAAARSAKLAANWVLGEVGRWLNATQPRHRPSSRSSRRSWPP